MKRAFFFALILVLIIVVIFAVTDLPLPFSSPGDTNGNGEPADNEPEPEPEPDIRVATLAAAGDLTAHMTQINQAHLGDGRYDFSPSFEYIAPLIRAADLAVVDFETGQAGADYGYHAYPTFNAPLELSAAVKDAGFDLVATANNHSLDMGLQGLKNTLTNLRAAGLQTFGTYMSPEEQQTPLIVDVNGIKIGFLSYTYGTNGIPLPAGHEYCVNMIEYFETLEPIIDEIERARAAGADLVAVYMHWGEMYTHEPPPAQREMARELAEAGADLILGSHQHVIQPIEWLTVTGADGSTRHVLVAHGLGNFLSNQFKSDENFIYTPHVQYGVVAQIELAKNMDSGEAWINDAKYEIIWVHRERRHRIIPIIQVTEVLAADPADFHLSPSLYQELQDGFLFNQSIVENLGFSENTPAPRFDPVLNRLYE